MAKIAKNEIRALSELDLTEQTMTEMLEEARLRYSSK